MTAPGSTVRRRRPWYLALALSVLVLVAAAVWLTVVGGGGPGSGEVGLGIGGLAVALASLVVSILQLRHAHRTRPADPPARLPAGARIRQDVTAAVPGAIAQGVIGGDIHNRFERPDPPPEPAAGSGPHGERP